MALIAGVDEAGRGPLAGPVFAAAVVLDLRRPIAGLADSKQLSASVREEIAIVIKERALAWALGRADVDEIDCLNILQATWLAMRRAVMALPRLPAQALIDGNRCPNLPCAAAAIIKGDATVPAISAASILAKTARDAEMRDWGERFPAYGFARHKGYATRLHVEALLIHGPCICHRRSFMPVRQALERALHKAVPWPA